MSNTSFNGLLPAVIGLAMLVTAIPMPKGSSSLAPDQPRGISVSWKKDNSRPNCPICKLTLTALPAAQGEKATSYEWQISRLGSVELQKNTQGVVWNVGYIEPTDTYTAQVRAVNASGRSAWFTKTVLCPSGCCTQ
jgi:hypothetical protein